MKFKCFTDSHIPIKGYLLEYNANRLSDLFPFCTKIKTSNTDLSMLQRKKGYQDIDGCTLPGSVWSKKRKNFTFFYSKRDVTDCMDIPVTMGQVFYLKNNWLILWHAKREVLSSAAWPETNSFFLRGSFIIRYCSFGLTLHLRFLFFIVWPWGTC
ncbi:MAG: hypothetical protein BWX92_04120 [Deltaproteobacteria bacterium ADurb.Bin135]|nr:MAG: hypothetical protein BWX92_04120 [Deltaproteobacteria bacterium ADurb.Bin135]